MKLTPSALKNIFFIALASAVLFGACKKDPKTGGGTVTPPPPSPPPATSTRTQLTLDSMYLYAKEIYFWNDALPTYEVFNPRQYISKSTDLANYEAELFAITQLKTNPATGKPYEFVSASANYGKYSYISDKTTQNPSGFVPERSAAVDLEGNGNDLGVRLGAYLNTSSVNGPFTLHIQAVYQNSPADKAGLTRGATITKINGSTVGNNYNGESGTINSAFNANSVTIEGKDANNVAFSKTLTKALYKSSPVYKAKVLTSGSKKIGYFALARFSNMSNAQSDIDAAFDQFAASNVKDLVIDLRYNGGGYISTATYILNKIAAADQNGKVMFIESFNQTMKSGQAKILAKQPLLDGSGKQVIISGKPITYADLDYSDAGNTELFNSANQKLSGVTNVVFITLGGTASASELLINSLKPYLNVHIVGKTTYGKPIGFFPIVLENRYNVYMSLFSTRNSLNQGEYYAGFKPDVEDVDGDNLIDDYTRDFGDPKENYLAAALNRIAPSLVFTGNARSLQSVMSISGKEKSVRVLEDRVVRDGNEFNGMIIDRSKLKLKR